MDTIAEKVFRHVSKIHGSISGEHGDGLLRTKYVPMMYGATMYDIFKQIKLIFDNKKIMNPGKKYYEQDSRTPDSLWATGKLYFVLHVLV